MTITRTICTAGWILAVSLGPAATVGQEVDYFVVLLEGKKAGHAIQTRSDANGQVTTSEQVHISVNRMGVPVRLQMTETAVETTDGRPMAFESIQELSTMRIKVSGRIRPDGKMEVTTESMGTSQTQQMDWPSDALMAEGLRLHGTRQGLRPGNTYQVKVFVPSLLQAVDAQVAIGPLKQVDVLGTTMELTEVRTTMDIAAAGKITTTSYVDRDYHCHKTIMPMAGMEFEMVRCTHEVATSPIDPVELVGRMFLPSPVRIEPTARSGPISYTLRPNEPGMSLPVPTTDTQSVRQLDGGRVEVLVRPLAPSGGSFPYDGNDPQLLQALQPNTFLQSNDRSVRDLAAQAVGDANSAAEAVLRIEEFVGRYIQDKALSVGYASAAEVVQTRQGDCTEHAVLAAAMCRAVGIPARVATGIAYVETFGNQTNAFGGHAWVFAYVADRWVCIDPAFKGTGRGGFDSGHITLAIGDGQPKDFFNLAVVLGQFSIEQIVLAQQEPQTVTAGTP